MCEIGECTINPDACLYGGTCVDGIGNYSCACEEGFSGDNCEQTPNFCADKDCGGSSNLCFNSLDDSNGACACDKNFFESGMYRGYFICFYQQNENLEYCVLY